MVDREAVNELVSIFYQKAKYKLFNVNSIDGEEFTKPIGIFISLGMTTSLKQIQDITSAISHCKGYTARVAELGSIKIGGIYLNYLTGAEPKQYPLDEGNSEGLMNRDEVLETISQLVNKSKDSETSQTELIEISGKLNKLTYLNNQLEESDGWSTHAIMEENEDYKIYHLRLNYMKSPDSNIEYRIGIFVEDEQQ